MDVKQNAGVCDSVAGQVAVSAEQQRPLSGYVSTRRLGELAAGLNIEGPRPYLLLPGGCAWYNLVQSLDEPLKGDTFDAVMERVRTQKLDYLEEAVGIDMSALFDQLVAVLSEVKRRHRNVLVHVHQYEGTTKLDRVLHERTGLPVILDRTNFAEHPVDYAKQYPSIDALVSLSQCAGLGTPAGHWIVPTRFMRFDVEHSLVFTNPVCVENHAVDLPLPNAMVVRQGSLLFVDGLWSPGVDAARLDEMGVLCLNADDVKVLDFVRHNTTMYDRSHNWEHAVAVALHATRILNTKGSLYLALLHDVCDHKYKKSIPRSALSKFITKSLTLDLMWIDDAIDRVSFSKSAKSSSSTAADAQTNATIDAERPELVAVQDGDRLEALGDVGIWRCETFVRDRGGAVPDDVVQHCYDKLLRLVPEGFIQSPAVAGEARRRHNVVVEYVRKHLSTTKLSFSPPELL